MDLKFRQGGLTEVMELVLGEVLPGLRCLRNATSETNRGVLIPRYGCCIQTGPAWLSDKVWLSR